MNEIVKVCTKHGELKEDQVRREKKQTRCRQCCLDRDRKWKAENRAQHNASSIRYKKQNREKVNEWTRKDRKKDPEKYRKWSKDLKSKDREKYRLREILRIHGLTREVYDKMMLAQNGLCKICNKTETRVSRCGNRVTRLSIDHCHSSLNIRGLLCHDCNTGLGKFKDSIETLKSAIQYLEHHKEKVA